MNADNPVSRRLASMLIGAIALANTAAPFTLGAGSAFADKGGPSGGGEGSNSGPGSSNSGDGNSGESDDNSADVAKTETGDETGDDNSTATTPTTSTSASTPSASAQKRRGRKKIAP